MAITWADILEWDTAPLEEIANELIEARNGLRETYEKGQDDLKAIQSQGEAVNAMRASTITNLASLERALTNINGALMAIEGAYDGVGTVIANIDTALAYASTYSCVIAPDGSVTAAPDAPPSRKTLEAAHTLSETVKKTLKHADQVDTDLYHALQDINNDRYTDGDGANNKVVGIPDVPQPNWSPSQNAAWWKSLPAERRRFLIEHCPDDIRHLDGLPATVRDEASRNALYGYVDAYGTKRQGALADAKQAFDEANTAPHVDRDKIIQTRAALKDLEALDAQLQKSEHAPAYLLDFNYDTKHHRTTAIVASGNPDTASYVSTLVPGIGTNVRERLGYYMGINDQLRAQAEHMGVDPNKVSTISYLGYVAPEGPGPKLYQAAMIDYANEGAPKIARFMEGLRAHGNANGHSFTNTLLTHSFGSTTGGKAMTQVAKGVVDNLIMCGSPGSGVQSIDQYNVPKGHVYESSTHLGDMVQDLGFDSFFGRDPKKLEGITHLSGDVSDTKANRHLYHNHPNPKFEGTSGSTSPLANHSAYFDHHTRAFRDFTHIMLGKEPTTDEEWAAIKAARAKENNGH